VASEDLDGGLLDAEDRRDRDPIKAVAPEDRATPTDDHERLESVDERLPTAVGVGLPDGVVSPGVRAIPVAPNGPVQ